MKIDYTPYNKQGDAYEDLLKPRLEKFLQQPLIKSDNRYSHYDFITENGIHVELKSRNYKSSDFNTTMLSKSKYDYILKQKELDVVTYVFVYFIKNDVLMYCTTQSRQFNNIVKGTQTYEHKYKNYTVENVLLDLSKFHIVDAIAEPNE